MKKYFTFHNGWLNIWWMIIVHFCLERLICGVGSDIMQIINGRRVVGFYFPTTHYYIKMLNIKLGTSVHLRTCCLWLITLSRVSCHRRSKALWKSYQVDPFLLLGLSSTLRRLSVLHRPLFSPSFWRRWGSESWRICRSTPSGQSPSACVVFLERVHD